MFMSVVREKHIVYTVQPGDTLFSIASKFGSTVFDIERANHLFPPFTDRYLIYPGWTILIPVPTEETYSIIYITSDNDTLYKIGNRFSAHVELLAGINRIQDPNIIFIGQPLLVPAFVYEIQPGDSLFTISQHFQIPMNQLLDANDGRPGFSLDLIYASYRLIIPMHLSRNIAVLQPLSGDVIQNGHRVEGYARVFEATVLTQIRDDNGVIVSNERFTTALEGPPTYGFFSTSVPFDQLPTTVGGHLWVYSRSALDGSIIDIVRLRVYF